VAFRCADERFSHVAVNGKVAFRVTIDPLLRAFIDALGEPIVSTSVNISSLPAETDVSRISKHYETWFDFALFPSNKIINEGGEASTLIEYLEKSQDDIEHIRCLREGSIPFYDIKKSFELPLVMFVCTANICRSPIAEKLFNSMLKEHSLKLSTDSSGLLEGGHMISLNSMQLLMERGISEAQGHVSKQISKQMIDSSWLVLTMEEKQRDFLREVHPNTNHKILTLNEITGYEGDIKDPYGSDLDSYRKTFGIIEDRLHVLLEKIINNEFSM
jgi:protein-tyrosine phosphatase